MGYRGKKLLFPGAFLLALLGHGVEGSGQQTELVVSARHFPSYAGRLISGGKTMYHRREMPYDPLEKTDEHKGLERRHDEREHHPQNHFLSRRELPAFALKNITRQILAELAEHGERAYEEYAVDIDFSKQRLRGPEIRKSSEKSLHERSSL